jgi:hypothetical protein
MTLRARIERVFITMATAFNASMLRIEVYEEFRESLKFVYDCASFLMCNFS